MRYHVELLRKREEDPRGGQSLGWFGEDSLRAAVGGAVDRLEQYYRMTDERSRFPGGGWCPDALEEYTAEIVAMSEKYTRSARSWYLPGRVWALQYNHHHSELGWWLFDEPRHKHYHVEEQRCSRSPFWQCESVQTLSIQLTAEQAERAEERHRKELKWQDSCNGGGLRCLGWRSCSNPLCEDYRVIRAGFFNFCGSATLNPLPLLFARSAYSLTTYTKPERDELERSREQRSEHERSVIRK